MTDKEQQSRARTAMLSRFQDLISIFIVVVLVFVVVVVCVGIFVVSVFCYSWRLRLVLFSISRFCIHNNHSFLLAYFQKTEKMPEVHVRQKLACTFPTAVESTHYL